MPAAEGHGRHAQRILLVPVLEHNALSAASMCMLPLEALVVHLHELELELGFMHALALIARRCWTALLANRALYRVDRCCVLVRLQPAGALGNLRNLGLQPAGNLAYVIARGPATKTSVTGPFVVK